MPKEIDALIALINRKQKEELLVPGSSLRNTTFQRTTTGSLAFDVMLGGGWPLNCWNEIIGHESSGKSTMALKTVAANQARNPDYHTLWVASEDFDPAWAEELGVNIDNITFVMTNVMEDAYDSVLTILSERLVDAVVIDSYPALVPSEEEDKTMMQLTVGRGAYLTNKFMRKSLSATRRSLVQDDRPCLGLFINQWRERVGLVFGDPRITPGGKGKNYTMMTRIDVAREEWIKDGTIKVGQVIKAHTIKNKTAPPQRVATVPFYFSDHKTHRKGSYDTVRQVFSIAMDKEIIEQAGSWYTFGTNHKWQGEKQVLAALQIDPLLLHAVENMARHVLLGEPLDVPPDPPRRRSITRSK